MWSGKQQQLTINKRYGGMADNDYLMSDGQNAFQNNIDIRTHPECIKLQRKLELQCATGTWLPTAWVWDVYSSNFSNFWVFTDDGKVYYAGNGNLVYTLPWWHKIISALTFGTYILFFYWTGTIVNVAYILRSNAGAWVWSWTANVTVAPSTVREWWFPPSTLWYAPCFNQSDDFIYISAWKNVYLTTLDQFLFFQRMLTFEDDVVWLVRDWSIIYIYLITGRKYMRDGASFQVEWYVDLWHYIFGVKQVQGSDYVMSWPWVGIYSSLYISKWLQFQYVRSARTFIDGTNEFGKFSYSSSAAKGNDIMWSDNKYVYFPNEDLWPSTWWVERIGSEYAWLPSAIDNFSLTHTWGNIERVGAIFQVYSNNVFIWVEDSATGNCFLLFLDNAINSTTNPPTYHSEGVFYTRKYILSASKRMWSRQFEFRYDLPSWTSVEIYYAKNGSTTYTSLTTLTSWSPMDERFSTAISFDFYEIQFKFVLKTTDTNVTPSLYDMNMIYDTNYI